MIFRIITGTCQILLFLAAFILQYFSDKKMGVVRYLSYKNMNFNESVFINDILSWYKYILIILLVLAAAFLIYCFIRRKSSKICFNFLLISLFSLISVYLIYFTDSEGLTTYYYWLFALAINILIEIIMLTFNLIKNKRASV